MFRKMRRWKQEAPVEECIPILKEEMRGSLCVIGDDGYPYAVPMDFYYEEETNCLYFHSAKEGHKIDAVRNCGKASFTTWNTGVIKEGDWAWSLTSIIAFGQARLVEDPELTRQISEKIGRKYFPTEEELQRVMKGAGSRVQIIELKIEHMTGKHVREA